MYKLNKKAIAGIFLIGSLGVVTSLYSKNKIEPEVDIEEMKTKKIEFDQELDGCIVYQLKTRKWNPSEQAWSNWELEFNKYYLGTSDEIYDMVALDIYGNQYYKKTVGILDNDYTTEDFKVIKRTYHEEQCETITEGEQDKIIWKEVGEPIVLENQKELPDRCMSKWILDTVKYEEIQPESQQVFIEDGTQMNGLAQAYNVVYNNGEIELKPTPIFSTITNIPNKNYNWKLVGFYEKSQELEQELSNNQEKKLYSL